MFKIFPINGGVTASDGFFAQGVSVGLRGNDNPDVAFIYSDAPCDISALFTTNKFQAAPIVHFLNKGEFRSNFVLINAKNANAMTGDEGVTDIDELLGSFCAKYPHISNPVMSSTGVIGVRLPKEKIALAFDKFDLASKDHDSAARAIMTTDAFKKEIALKVVLEDGQSFHVGAMAKGAGMINPAMATMLCFITTDAAAPKADIDEIVKELVRTTFNAISVDGDTSTNDTIMILSNGKSGAYDKAAFTEALRMVMHNMALLMAKDGEGAKKLVAFEVKGAKNEAQAETAAKALSNSLLVKTAVFGEDPNWGRIASTIGASGVECDAKTLVISFGDVCVYNQGKIFFDKETEVKAAAIMKQDEFKILCDLGLGDGRFVAYGCDLGYEYVKINADYRT
jgi:glutamate N-acetyltransferase / amino-acid N-acetyltransferase